MITKNPLLLQAQWGETPGRKTGAETPGQMATPSTRMWDATPGHATPGAMTPGRDTPGHTTTPSASTRKNRWDETPRTERGEEGSSVGKRV
jgi:splicing factor 3B subunit 1